MLRSEKKGFEFKWDSILHVIKSLTIFIVIACGFCFALYYLYNIYSISSVKSHCSGCEINFGVSDEVENTLFVFESPEDSSLIGAWLVVNNKQTGKMLVSFIPGGVYINDYSKTLNTYIETSNIKYVGNLINSNKPTQYELWELTN
ncbi:MAG TPA: hypothetical protein VHA74_00275, partial [Candidatus Dojkabacteria bacterium]|nr:hypothetical protein [Candidatus Dojkabacteria bacterium]